MEGGDGINNELIINTAATINNMSFFSHPDSALFRMTELFTSGKFIFWEGRV